MTGLTPPQAQTSQGVNLQPTAGRQSYTFVDIGQQGQYAAKEGASPVDPIIVPNLDDPKEQEKWRKEAPEDVESRHKYDLLEERLRAVEGMDIFGNIDASELSLVPDLVIPPK